MAIGDLGGKQNGALGFCLGAMLGPIGWIVVAVLSSGEKSDVSANPPPATNADQGRIAKLEAELAKLKSEPVKAKVRAKDDLAGDGEIPTFKI